MHAKLLWQFFCIVTIAGYPVALGQSMRDLMEEVLDQVGPEIRIEDQPLPEALQTLEQKTGLRLVLDEAAIQAMPYGLRTRISLTIAGVPLRQGLRQTLEGLGLAMKMEDDRIQLTPIPAVERLGRRLTLEETGVLRDLAVGRWSNLPLEQWPLQFRGYDENVMRADLESALRSVRGPNALYELEVACQQVGFLWVPEGPTILVYPRSWETDRRLDREISLEYHGVTLEDVLLDLGERAGVLVKFQPGVLESIQASRRRLDLVQRRTTVRQVLERLCGATGITYHAGEDGLYIRLSGSAATRQAATRADRQATDGDRARQVVAVVRVAVAGGGLSVEFPFYEGELPAALERLRQQKLAELLRQFEQQSD